MDGYIVNKSNLWAHAMKRTIGPGPQHKVLLDDVYDQYGEKHGLEKGDEFVEWLKSIKLSDTTKWAIVYNDGKDSVQDEQRELTEKDLQPVIKTSDKISPKTINVQQVAALSVRKAREILPEVSDIKLLRYSLQEANKLANKDSLCRLIRKRITALEVAGFR